MLAAVILAEACSDSQRPVAPIEEQTSAIAPAYTLAPGTVSALLGRSVLAEGFKAKRKTGSWEIDIHAEDPADVVVATLTIQVTAGTVRFYEAGDPSCSPTTVSVGHAWLDRGEIPHIARNETDSPVTLLVTLLVPPGATPRIDEPAPGNCPF